MRDVAGFLARSDPAAYGAWNAHRCCQSGPSFVGHEFNSLPCLALRCRAGYLQDRGHKSAFAWGRGRLDALDVASRLARFARRVSQLLARAAEPFLTAPCLAARMPRRDAKPLELPRILLRPLDLA